MSIVAFERVEHLVRVPVVLGDERHWFLVDTGIGVTVVSPALATASGVKPTGETFTGRRMSGQELTLPVVRLPEVTVGDHSVKGHLAVVADLGPMDGPTGFAGILGPSFFADQAVTTDPDAMTLTVRPAVDVDGEGVVVPLDVRRDGISVDPFVRLVLPSGREICVEVDTGSQNLILDTRFLEDCAVGITDPSVTTTSGTDETGHEWTRHWCTIAGAVHLAGAPQTTQLAPRVQFQDIIHDGLIGTDFLERFRFTLDVSGGRLVLSPRATTAVEATPTIQR